MEEAPPGMDEEVKSELDRELWFAMDEEAQDEKEGC